MNFNLYTNNTLKFPNGILSQILKLEDLEEIIIPDAVKDMEDDKLLAILESINNDAFEPNSPKSYIILDSAFSFLNLKIKKRLQLIINIITQDFKGVESIKQVEKLENVILNYLKQYFILVKASQRIIQKGSYNFRINDLNTFEALIYYSDNQELLSNILKIAIQFFQIDNTDFSNKNRIFGNTETEQHYSFFKNIIVAYYQFYLLELREEYPYISEIFRSEKFFKETGIRPLFMEMPTETIHLEFQGEVNATFSITNMKKELTDNYLGLLSAEQLIEKKGLNIKKDSPLFFQILIALRTKKNFTNLKQRTSMCINSLCFYKLHFENFFLDEIKYDKTFNYQQDVRAFLGLKDFPFLDYYLDMQDLIIQFTGPKFYDGFLEMDSLDLSNEQKFLEDAKLKIGPHEEEEGDGQLKMTCERKQMQVVMGTLGWMFNYLRELSKPRYQKIKNENTQQEITDLLNGISNLIASILDFQNQADPLVIGGFYLGLNQFFRQNSSNNITQFNGSQDFKDTLQSALQNLISTILSNNEPKAYENNIDFLVFANALTQLGIEIDDQVITNGIQQATGLDQQNLNILQLLQAFAIYQLSSYQEFNLEKNFVYTQLFTLSLEKNVGINFNGEQVIQLTQYLIHSFDLLSENTSKDSKYAEMIEKLSNLIPLKLQNQYPQLLNYKFTESDDFYRFTKIGNTFMEGYLKYIEQLKENQKENRNLELQYLESPAANNSYNKCVLSSIYALNAYKSSYSIQQIITTLTLFIEKGGITLNQEKFQQILNSVTELVHPAINRQQGLRELLKNNLFSKGYPISYEHGDGVEITGLLEFLSSFLHKNLEILKQSSILNFQGENRQSDAIRRQGTSNFSDDLTDKQQISEEQWNTLKVFRTVEILYQLMKYYLYIREEEFSEGNLPNWCYNEIITHFLEQFTTIIPQIASDFVSQRTSQFIKVNNAQIQSGKATLNLQNFQSSKNRWTLSKKIFSQSNYELFPQDSMKYILRLPYKLQFLLRHGRTDNLIQPLLSAHCEKYLELLNPNFEIKGSLQDIIKNFINFVIYEQQIRKTLLQRQQTATFQLPDYFKKLAAFQRRIHAAFQLNNIFVENQGGDKEKQYLTELYKVFQQNWYQPFHDISNNFPFLEVILTTSYEEEDKQQQLLQSMSEFFHETIIFQNSFTFSDNQTEGPISDKMLYTINNLKNTFQKRESQIPAILEKQQHKLGDEAKIEKKLLQANNSAQGLQKLAILITKIHQKVWSEVISNGLVLKTKNIEFLTETLKIATQILMNGQTQKCYAKFAVTFAQSLLKVFKDCQQEFHIDNIPLIQQSISLSKRVSEDFLMGPHLQSVLTLVQEEISYYPPLHTPAIIHGIFEFLQKLMTYFQLENTEQQVQSKAYFKNSSDILSIIDIYIYHYNRAPVSVSSYLNNSRLLFRPLLLQVEQLQMNILLQTTAEIDEEVEEIDYQNILYIMTDKIVNLSQFLQHSGYNEDLVKVVKESLNIIIACLTRLQNTQVTTQNSEYLRRTIMTNVLQLRYKSSSEQDQQKQRQLCTEIHSQVFRITELLFIFQKNNFLKSNLEIRLKSKFYKDETRDFVEYFNVQQLEKMIEPDMYENGKVLSNVLANIIEGFNEQDLDKIRSEIEILKKNRKQAMKKGEEEEEGEEGQEQQEENNEQQEEPEFDEDEESEEAQQYRQKKKEEAEAKKRAAEEEAMRIQMENENRVWKKLLKLKSVDFVSISSSNVVKLTQTQQKILNKIIENLQKRINSIFKLANKHNELANLESKKQNLETLQQAIQKLTEEIAADPEQQQEGSEKKEQLEEKKKELQKETLNVENLKKSVEEYYEYDGYYMDFQFMSQLLITFMRKYPLCVPYILETKFKSAEIAFLARHQELNFLDFLLLMQPFTNYRFTEIIHYLCTNHYTFIEDKKTYNFTSSGSYYSNALFERNFVWFKRCMELKDLFKHETGLTVLKSLIGTIQYFIREQRSLIDMKRIEKILAFMCNLINKANEHQDLHIITELGIIDIFNQSYQIYIEFKLQSYTGQKIQLNQDYEQLMRFILNKNFFEFFSPKDAEIEGATEHNELIQNRTKFNIQEILEGQTTATLTGLPAILRNQHANTYGLPDRNKSIIDMEQGITVTTFKTAFTKMDECQALIPEFENNIETLFWKKQVLHSALLLKYTKNNEGLIAEIDNSLQELENFFTTKQNLITFKQELKPQFYIWLNQYFQKTRSFNLISSAFSSKESLLFKTSVDIKNSQSISDTLHKMFFPPDPTKRDSAFDLFNPNPKKTEDETQVKDEDNIKQMRQSILKSNTLLEEISSKVGDFDFEKKSQPFNEQEIGVFDETYLENEDQFFFEKLGFEPNCLQLYGIKEKDFKTLDFSDKKSLLLKQRQIYIEKQSTVKTLLRVQREQQILSQFLKDTTGQFIPNEISENLTNTVQNQLEQAFEHLSENDKRAVLISWDQSYTSLLSEKLQKQSEIYKQSFVSNSNNTQKNYQKQNKKNNKQFLNAPTHLLETQDENIQNIVNKLQNISFYITELPMFDESILLKLFDKMHQVSVKNHESFENSLKSIKRTFQLLSFNPYNAFKICDALQFQMILQNYKASLNHLPHEPKISHLLNLPIYDTDLQRPYHIQRDIKLIKTSILFDIFQDLLTQNINTMQNTIFQYPLWNKPEITVVIDGNEQKYAPQFTPLEIFQDVKLSAQFKGIVDHKKEGDNIHILTIISLYNKSVLQERAPQQLPVDVIPDFKKFAFKYLDLAMTQYLHRVQFIGTQKVFSTVNYPKMENIQKELHQEFIFEYINYDIIENGNRLRDSAVFHIIKNFAKDIKAFSDFIKKFFETILKYISPKLTSARENILEYTQYLIQKQNLTNLNEEAPQETIQAYINNLSQYNNFFVNDMGNFRRCIKDIIQLFISITIQLEEDKIKNEVIEQKKEQVRQERIKQIEEEKELREKDLKEMREKEEIEKQKYLAEQAEKGELEEENEEEKPQDQEDGEGEEGEDKENLNTTQDIINNMVINVELQKQDLISIQEQLQQKKFTLLTQLQQIIASEDLIIFLGDLVDFIFYSIKFGWNQQIFDSQVYSQYNYSLKSIYHLFNFLYEEDNSKMEVYEKTVESSLHELLNQQIGFGDQFLLLQQGLQSCTTVQQLKEKEKITELRMYDLIEIMNQRLVGLISHFIQSGQINKKQTWMNYLNKISKVPQYDLQMKQADLRAKGQNSQEKSTIIINCNRNEERKAWNSSIGDLLQYNGQQFASSQLQINFLSEDNPEDLLLQKERLQEWLTLILKEIADPQTGLFQLSQNKQTIYLSETSFQIPDFDLQLRLVGRVLAKAIIEGLHINLDFTKPFLKQILGLAINFSDLEEIDIDLYQKLNQYLIEDKNTNEENKQKIIEDQTFFCYQREILGVQQTVELVKDGSLQSLNEENKIEYVKTFALHKLQTSIDFALKPFLAGFYEVLPQEQLQILNEVELGRIFSGRDIIDVEQLKVNARYNEYGPDSDQSTWLWEILQEFNDAQKSQFIFLVTSTLIQPSLNEEGSGIEIKKAEGEKISVHPSIKQIEIPEFTEKEQLLDNLLLAIEQRNQGLQL